MVTGVTPSQLAHHYPRLYHMADGASWGGLQRHGLLCTAAIVQLFEVPSESAVRILQRQRTESVRIEHPVHGKAVIRDQKPLNRKKLEGCLKDCSFEHWLEMLNSRVFFWLTRERLLTLMCAREYCAQTHVVLTLDTLSLVQDFSESITLAPMNTGNARPFAHPRGLQTFSHISQYPFAARLPRGPYYTVVELAVEGGIPNLAKYLVEAAMMRCSTCDKNGQKLTLVKKLFSSP